MTAPGGRRAERTRRTLPRPRPVTLALAAVALLASAHGTFAFWTDDANVQSGGFTAAALDITLDGNLAGAANNGGTWTQNSFALDAMLPGESRAVSFVVANAGTAGLTYAVTGTSTGALATGLRFSIYSGGAATNSGTAAAGNRTGTCAGSSLVTDATLSSVASTLVSTRRPLAVGANETVCVIARLDASAPNSLQGTTATSLLTFTSRQVGS
jgi:predicted ribosomally synthesized peptide with SipW-like signal peptide